MSVAQATIGESCIDLVTNNYGRIEALIDYCLDNGLVLDFEETALTNRVIDDVLKKEVGNIKPAFSKKPTPKKEVVKVVTDQNLVDLALQETGAVEGFVAFLRSNELNANDDAVYGAIVQTMSEDIANSDVRKFYKDLNYKISTGFVEATPTGIPLTGDDTTITGDSTIIVGDQTTY